MPTRRSTLLNTTLLNTTLHYHASHYKVECGADARLVHNGLKDELPLGAVIFLDSDNLNDLRLLVRRL